MKNKNNNQNEFERLGGQKSGGGGYIPPIPPLDPPLNAAPPISLSLESEVEEKEKFKIQSSRMYMLHLLPNTLSTWHPDEYTLICMRSRIDKCKIRIYGGLR